MNRGRALQQYDVAVKEYRELYDQVPEDNEDDIWSLLRKEFNSAQIKTIIKKVKQLQLGIKARKNHLEKIIWPGNFIT